MEDGASSFKTEFMWLLAGDDNNDVDNDQSDALAIYITLHLGLETNMAIFNLLRELAKATIIFVKHVCLSVSPFACYNLAPTWRTFMKFDV